MAPVNRSKKFKKPAKCPIVETKKKQFKHFDPFISDFAFVAKRDDFVDKSLLIEAIFNEDALGVLVTAPPQTAKSTNIDMIKKFVEIQVGVDGAVVEKEASPNYKIFKDLLIFQDKNFVDRHFASYPVVHVSFKDIECSSFYTILQGFKSALYKCFCEHEYLLKSHIWSREKAFNISTFNRFLNAEILDPVEIERSLLFLTWCLYNHFGHKKVCILIDDYDAPVRNIMLEKTVSSDKVRKLLYKIFANTFNENEFIEKAFITGVSYYGIIALSAGDQIEKYLFLGKHKLVSYFGLTEDEVGKLLSKFLVDDAIKEKLKVCCDGFYNGFVSLGGVKLFSLWTVLHFLRDASA